MPLGDGGMGMGMRILDRNASILLAHLLMAKGLGIVPGPFSFRRSVGQDYYRIGVRAWRPTRLQN